MRSFELRILVLHPHLDDVNDENRILEANERVLRPLPQKFSNPWICEFRHASLEQGLDAMITFRRLHRADDPEFHKILDTFCDDLFRVSGNTSLESISNGQDVLFKPVVVENNDVDQAFVRSFVISMGKNLTEDPTFREPQTLGNNFFTRDPVRWFMGPYDLTTSLYIYG
jgi:hypothetical protein